MILDDFQRVISDIPKNNKTVLYLSNSIYHEILSSPQIKDVVTFPEHKLPFCGLEIKLMHQLPDGWFVEIEFINNKPVNVVYYNLNKLKEG